MKEKKMLEFPGLGHGISHGLYREAVKATEASWRVDSAARQFGR